jgi:hypothetical protein
MVDMSDDDMKMIQKPKQRTVKQAPDISDEELIAKTLGVMEKESLRKAGITDDEPIVERDTFAGQTTSTGVNFYPIKDLPSKFKFYNAKIMARPLKVIEVKKLSSLDDTNFNFIINDILSRAVKGIDINKLFVADKVFLIFWLRANTYKDSGYTVDFTCPKCKKESTFHFELQNLEIQYVDDRYDPNQEITLHSGNKVKINFLRVEDEFKISRFQELQGQLLKDIDKELLSLACMIQTINGETKDLLERYYWMLEVDPLDYSYLNSYVEKYGMGVKPYMNVTCNKCGGMAPVGISFRSEFFLPSYSFE